MASPEVTQRKSPASTPAVEVSLSSLDTADITTSDLEGPNYEPLNPRTLLDSFLNATIDNRQIQLSISKGRLPKSYTREEHAKATVYKSVDASQPRHIVKCSWLTSQTEAVTLAFIQSRTTIPVPSVIFSKIDNSTKKTMICMSYIEGTRLSDAWPQLDAEQKVDIEAQLRGYLAELRSLEPPVPTYIGGVNGGPVRDVRLRMLSIPATGEPVSSVAEFEDWLLGTTHTILPARVKAYIKNKMVRQREQKGYNIVFTHGGLYPENILVRNEKEGRTMGQDNWKIVGILDWSSAGWYPEYWEFVKAMEQGFCSMDGCAGMVAKCVPEYREEVLLAEYYKLTLDH
ncbi:uncharacterized protein DFL_000370 [Arthrobotrys flagrans]|uniref:Aminoglycoside phosphotransferase domain-containing protein n=1 Tax=Arthrobotrys flagrans TaxID=97331 RepID=A0A437AEY3_ARTFL|nr:hypothetical protein DFL_000370 [Arthrobotrys flagrans]